jgi:hypothetical protein
MTAGHPTFFKFFSRPTAEIVLRNRSLRWSRPGTFNDPFDCQFDLYFPELDDRMKGDILERQYQSIFEGGPADPNNKLGEMLLVLKNRAPKWTRQQYFKEMAAGVDGVLANATGMQAEFFGLMRTHSETLKLLCLSVATDSVTMWSHYAEQHRGVALRFETPEGVDSPWRLAEPVNYTVELPLAMTRENFVDYAAGRAALDPQALARTMVLSKAKEWEYEKEWRIASGDGRDKTREFEDIEFNRKELTGLILGARMPDGDKARFVDLARNLNPSVEILQARLAARAYRIEVAPA